MPSSLRKTERSSHLCQNEVVRDRPYVRAHQSICSLVVSNREFFFVSSKRNTPAKRFVKLYIHSSKWISRRELQLTNYQRIWWLTKWSLVRKNRLKTRHLELSFFFFVFLKKVINEEKCAMMSYGDMSSNVETSRLVIFSLYITKWRIFPSQISYRVCEKFNLIKKSTRKIIRPFVASTREIEGSFVERSEGTGAAARRRDASCAARLPTVFRAWPDPPPWKGARPSLLALARDRVTSKHSQHSSSWEMSFEPKNKL